MVAQAQLLSRQFRQRDDRLPLTLGVEEDVAAAHLGALLVWAKARVPQLQLKLLPGCAGEWVPPRVTET